MYATLMTLQFNKAYDSINHVDGLLTARKRLQR
jgi:hypothetical protein